jgi:hypothetical protein
MLRMVLVFVRFCIDPVMATKELDITIGKLKHYNPQSANLGIIGSIDTRIQG